MSTIEDFENAPVGSTATSPNGNIAIKTSRRDLEWSVYDPRGWYRDNYRSAEMVLYTLTPAAPTTAREALDLAWELAHEVKEGQTIPEGTRYLEFPNSEMREYTAPISLDISPALVPKVRTLEPLPDPEPDWLDAPAVLAECDCSPGEQTVYVNYSEIAWTCTDCDNPINPEDMKNVTPLYPKDKKHE